MSIDAKTRAQEKYDKSHTRMIQLKLNKGTDSDILSRLDEVPNRQGYIKSLIRNDMRRPGEVIPLDSIRKLLLPVAHKYGIRRISVFGSYARGEARPDSDVDLLIDGAGISGLLDYSEMTEHFRRTLGKDVDIIMESAVASDNSRRTRRLREHIERDKILIYENL